MAKGAPDYTRITEIKGLSPTATLVTIAVDSNGKILGVLQGDYAGSLKTLAVDSQGRMLAVLSDPEDVFGNPHYMGAAELAARLGALSRFERRGQVLFQDDFESGLSKWVGEASLTPDLPDLSTAYTLSGVYSCRLHTSATIDCFSSITHYMGLPTSSKIGLEFAFSLPSSNTLLECSQYYYDGTTRTFYYVRYNQLNSTLEYYGTDLDWHAFATSVSPYPRDYCFNVLKLVVDLTTKKFVRCILNKTTYDMSALSPWSEGYVYDPFLQTQIRVKNPAAAAKTVYVDDIILTQNEPA